MFGFWQGFSFVAVLHVLVLVTFIPWVLLTKKDSASATAWLLLVIFAPFLGAFLFWMFGYNYVYRRTRDKQDHRSRFRAENPVARAAVRDRHGATLVDNAAQDLAECAGAFRAMRGNEAIVYHDTAAAFAALLDAIDQARHHVHLEFFIVHADETGRRLIEALIAKARAGVEVRLLVDGMGSLRLSQRSLADLRDAGGKTAVYLPVGLLQSFLHVNLRNHRKVVVVDGQIGFTGGMNIGDEYLGRSAYFGYWRDTFMRIAGPAVASLQRVFAEDWHFASGESLDEAVYFPPPTAHGEAVLQIVESGPDQEYNAMRAIYLMAVNGAQRELRLASPYFVPDGSLLDALRLARFRGVRIRLLSLSKPDHYISYFASRYFWDALLDMGVEVYQYRKGMMHSKLMLADGHWAMVGSANLDFRSLFLNFEAGCIVHTPEVVANLEAAFDRDLADAARIDESGAAKRTLLVRALENGCRLLAPNL